MKSQLLLVVVLVNLLSCAPEEGPPSRPRILVSTDIGGTDPDDNQSMVHLLMYANEFEIEGLVSSPSYGDGSKEEILRTVDLYEKDLPRLAQHSDYFPPAESLRSVTKQGQRGLAPHKGYSERSEGSDWIIECARKPADQPLWILVWGGLEDVAQALHDAPDIQDKIRVYWIGGPNKKWSVNSYCYIAAHFPDLWFLEVNNSYYGFFSDTDAPDTLRNDRYSDVFIRGAGHLGKDFLSYRQGGIKMGDTPSVLYLLHGDPNDPRGESWGGSFERMRNSTRHAFDRNTSLKDTVTLCSVLQFNFEGPNLPLPLDSACITMEVGGQVWGGYYQGNGKYTVSYSPKRAETLSYDVTSEIPGFQAQMGEFVVDNQWPGRPRESDFWVGNSWYTDRADPSLYDRGKQGAKSIKRYREEALLDWAKRWEWLRD